ncbi:origin recognition complex subunit 3 KNAG_0H02480 [Huiozyma naganishii CBS 8797]|uniref:Uncharacterized protein n=1 Tax=Huiozyma naganishii (strain ATCC MYA-139 / BCRC 22969 / CBS 8797 / KCTC 17520 / NBRC 10181 / NCYC 3082 / Yp74L-3) TaxID=1071383 RepID=J7RPK9_HUIN7|nr:hypothetical protein KNAG_0H02480 [Kazachstania naganishii CBS 8797]CCK71663.1 hypothetical protein KNAG_0H02480 [Kazachstania naganishii CBS 8797]
MDFGKFVDAQKTHKTLFPTFDYIDDDNDQDIPFVRLLDGEEPVEVMTKRWELYNQLHSHFHDQVDDIVSNIETDLKKEISHILFDSEQSGRKSKPCFKTLFLLGSDSSTDIEFPEDNDPSVMNVLIELSPKESPNVRMMLRRSMFKLFTQTDAILRSSSIAKELDVTLETMPQLTDDLQTSASYDLTLVENYKKLFHRDLNLVFNFKDTDSFHFADLNDFIVLLRSALKNEHVKMNLVFNINTNISNIEKNLKQSTLRLLKRNFHKLDVSSNKGFKYGNRIFQIFLDTVDGKLNLSARFVNFILDKMANNTNHNLQLLTKILDYSLMSYFFQNPFSVFIDPVNTCYLQDTYLKLLAKCPTYMFFIDGLIKERAPKSEILSLIHNEDNALENFFVEFLVRDNPINRHAKFVANFLEEELNVSNFNLIELYHNMLEGKLDFYLKTWPQCEEHKEKLAFKQIDTMFQELFTIDNGTGLLTQAMFPAYKSNMEDDLLCSERILPELLVAPDEAAQVPESLKVLNSSMDPIISQLFQLYREAGASINIYDFYCAFKETLPQQKILQFLQDESLRNEKLKTLLSGELVFDKVALVLFMQGLFDLEHLGFTRSAYSKNSEDIEKAVWRGI